MAQPKSPVTANTGTSRIKPIGQTTGSHFGLSDAATTHNPPATETAPLGS